MRADFINFPKRVKLVEVGPRDGLQNEKTVIPTDIKIRLINDLIAAGLQTVEATSFVSPKWVPQLADATEVVAALDMTGAVAHPVLVPNMRGYDNALAAGVSEIAVFTAASNSFNQKNINCTIDESLARISPVMLQAAKDGIKVRGYVSCVLGCPYEGDISPDAVLDVSTKLIDMGCYEVSLGDTIGKGQAESTRILLDTLTANLPVEKLAVHFHNTYAQALTNILVALHYGISTIDSSVAGLGGCPYAKGASGNVATEDVVYLLDGLGIETGVDLKRLIEAGNRISEFLQRPNQASVARALS